MFIYSIRLRVKEEIKGVVNIRRISRWGGKGLRQRETRAHSKPRVHINCMQCLWESVRTSASPLTLIFNNHVYHIYWLWNLTPPPRDRWTRGCSLLIFFFLGSNIHGGMIFNSLLHKHELVLCPVVKGERSPCGCRFYKLVFVLFFSAPTLTIRQNATINRATLIIVTNLLVERNQCGLSKFWFVSLVIGESCVWKWLWCFVLIILHHFWILSIFLFGFKM